MTHQAVASRSTRLTENAWSSSLEPHAPVDDLEPLRDIVGNARVVAIGESAHYIPEFHVVRHRVLRFLVERMGFTTYALEAPFTTARAIDAWLADGEGDIGAIADEVMPIRLGRVAQLHLTLAWIREHNLRAREPVRFLGTDVPGSGGSIVPALRRVRAAIATADPIAIPLIERALELARSHDSGDTFAVLAMYGSMPAAEQDELTALLSRLLSRVETVASHLAASGVDAGEALLDLRGAWYADHLHRDVAGPGLPVAAASRDAFMAEVVLDRLERHPDERVVVASHNVHIQKLAAGGSALGQLPQGSYLATALGDDYRAIAVTAPAGRTAQIQPNPTLPEGFEIAEVDLGPAPADSLDAQLGGNAPLAIADLRDAPDRGDLLRRMRMEGYFLDLPVADAFDAVAWVPRSSVSSDALGSGQ